MLAIRLALICVLLSFVSSAFAVIPPAGGAPAPTRVSVPTSSTTGTFSVTWAMAGSSELMSAQQTISKTGGTICPGDCTNIYEFQLEQSFNGGPFFQIYEGTAKIHQVHVSPGRYFYRVRAKEFNNRFAQYGEYTMSHQVIVEDDTPKSPENPVDFSFRVNDESSRIFTPSQQDLVGETAVNFRVNEAGAATMEVPIAVSAGIAQVTPNISLSYNSNNTRSSTLGTGWALNGISSITRCARTRIHDEPIEGIVDMSVSYDSNDRFCLDGQKLILMTGTYGGHGATYKTLKDSFETITSYTGSVNGPSYFKVKTKAGETKTYGTGNANNYPAGDSSVIKSWYLKSVKDVYNNGIYYNYKTEHDGKEFLVDYINYGSAADTNLGKVQFTYENKSKVSNGFFNGSEYKQTQRIDYITTYYQTNSTYRYYDLSYEVSPSSLHDRLTSIKECAATNVHCLTPLSFEWSDREIAFDTDSDMFLDASTSEMKNYSRFFDVNGDGITDHIYPESGHWNVKYGKTVGYMGDSVYLGSSNFYYTTDVAMQNAMVMDFNGDLKQDLLIPVKSGNSYKWYVIYHNPHNPLAPSECPGFGFNLFTRMKLSCLSYDNMAGTNFADKHLFTTPSLDVFIMDINGDGLQDFGYTSSGKLFIQTNGAGGEVGTFNTAYNAIHSDSMPQGAIPWKTTHVFSGAVSGFDANGDGAQDLVAYQYSNVCTSGWGEQCNNYSATYNWKLYLSDGHQLVSARSIVSSRSAIDKKQFGDFNGDGLSDLLYAGSDNKWRVAISDGKGFKSSISTAITQSHGNKVKVLDYDLDGRTDVLYWSNGWRIKNLSNGGTYFSYRNFMSNSGDVSGTDNGYSHITDMNGDGQPELLLLKNNSWIGFERDGTNEAGFSYVQESKWRSPNLIKSFSTRFGKTTAITYESSNDESVYTLGQEVTFPVVNLKPRYPLVSQVEKPDGIGGTNLVKYHYTGLRAHLLGHGLLGFAGVTSVDANNTLGVEIATTTTYNQGFNPNLVYQGKILTGSFSDWRKIGMPKETMVIAANGVKSAVLDESKNTTISYKERTPSSNSGSLVKPYFTYVAKSEDTKRTLDTSYHAKTGYLNPVDVSTTEHTKSYDNWGNVTQTTIAVTDSTLLETYTTTTNNYYGKTDASNRCGSNVTQGAFSQYTLYGRLTCSTVTKSRTGETAITTKAAFAYNSKGVLSEEESSPGTNLSKKTVRTYTSTGLLNRVTDYAKSFNPETGGYDTTSRYTQNYYDGTDKRFPSSIKNTLGHTVAYKYDSKLGKVKSETSNGLTKSYYYDAFASPIGTKSPITGKYTNINYYLCESSALCDVPSTQLGIDIVFAVEMLKSGSPTTIAYYDTFRRKVATRVAGFESGRYIYTGTIYDARGRITRTYAPSNFSPKKDYGKSFGYDLFDRPIWEMTKFDNRNIEGGATSSTTYIHYTGNSVKSVNTLGESTEHRNAMGEITSLDDKTGTGVITYAYYADGKLRKTTDVDNNEITLTYDIAGNKTQTDDPDMGVWQYKYNGFGEQTWQKDAKLQETWTYFDTIGRKTLRVDDAKGSGSSVRSSCWLYDSNFKGSLDKTRLMSGKKTSAQCKSNASSIEDKTYSYDDKNRPTGTYTKIKSLKEGTVSYYSAQYYNNVGKVAVKQSSYNEAVFYEFSSNGTPYRTRQASNNKLLHVIEATDEQGRVSRERSYVNGGSVLQTSTYNAGNGSLSERRASGRWGAISYQKFTFDRVGNLKQKVNQFDYNNDGILNASTEKYVEDYSYDNMNRVEQHSINNIGYEYFCYNNLGNITDKRRGSLNCASADTHTYKSDKPHQLHTFGGSTYYYDANGSVTSGGGRTIEYAAFGKPERISKSGTVVQFQYGANRSRFERVDTDSSGYIVTHYNAGAEHIYKNNIHETKFYENNLLITELNGAFGYKALIKDHQGSVAAVVDEQSFLEQHYRYDAFGKQYTLASKNAASATAVAGRTYNTQKGFTGHEMIASVGVIHMNGRIYDAVLGRFLQADPLIQAPNDSQSYNRYSYVRNNPLSLIDPTGYSWLGDLWDNIKPFVGLIVGVIGAWVCGPACAQLGWQIAAVGAVAGAAHAAANGGNIVTGALLGAFTAGAAKLGYIASAIAGGIASKVQGGKFHHGFWSAGLGSAFGGGFGTTNAAKILSSAIIGGTISKLTGGKFKNGAIGAAFATAMALDWGRAESKQNTSLSNTCSANPINLATGEKYLIMLDYKASGASRLVFERSYASFSKGRSSLGFGWRHNFERQLIFKGSTVFGQARYVTYQTQKNKLVNFVVKNDDLNQYQNSSNTADKLVKIKHGWQLTLSDGTVESFDNRGRLIQVNEIGLYQQNLNYNERGLLVSVNDNANQQITFTYNRLGLITSLESPDGVTNYEYNFASKVLTKALTPADEDGKRGYKEYHYDDVRHRTAITSISNELGHVVHHMTYDDSGRAIMSALGNGAERVDVAFFDNRVSQVTNALGRITTYQFDSNNQPTTIDGHATPNCIGANQTYQYDKRGNIISKTDWNGVTTTFTFNDRNLETSRTDALGTELERTVTTTWHPEYAVVTSINSQANRQTFEYSDSGLLLSHTTTDLTADKGWLDNIFDQYPSRTVTYEYNDLGQLNLVDGARTDVVDITTYRYDNEGNLVAITNAVGHTSQMANFDKAGRPTMLIAANGLRTELSYNERGWLDSKAIVTGEGERQIRRTTRYYYAHSGDYHGNGQIERIISSNGAVTEYSYDKAYRVISMSNNLDETVEYTYDLEGNPIQTDTFNDQGELIKQQQQQFNELSQLIAQVGANYRVDYHYNAQGLLSKTTNGLGNSTTQAFDALNRLIGITDAAHGEVYQGYNEQNKVTHVTDQRGLTTHYFYNGFGEKVKQISPDTGITLFRYNEAGLLIEKTDNSGQIIEYEYDAIGRITHTRYVGAANDNVFYQYDVQTDLEELPLAVGAETYGIGRTSKVIDNSGASHYRYNARGQLTANVYQLQGEQYIQKNLYNRRGLLTTQTYPSGMEVSFSYDGLGRVDGIIKQSSKSKHKEIIINNVTYLPFGGMEGIDYANGVIQHNAYDVDGRLEEITLNKGSLGLHTREYNYDAANRITDIVNVLDSSLSQHYDYDESNRLVNAQGIYGQLNYHYDKVGNRLNRKWKLNDGQIVFDENYQYAENSNQLDSILDKIGLITREFSYNKNGHTEFDSKQDKTLTYNAANRLADVTFGDGSSARYIYNAKGQRVIKLLTGIDGKETTVHYHFNLQDLLIAETTGSGQPLVEYVYLNKQRVASIRYHKEESIIEFVHNDHLGSPMLQTDLNGAIIWSNKTLPFGQGYKLPNSTQGFGFPGQYQDIETGMNYNYFRDYDPTLGRYIQSDPIGLYGGLNTFGYVLGNPIGLVDIKGLAPDKINFVRGVPINAQYHRTTYGNHVFNAPPGANFHTVYKAGNYTGTLNIPFKWNQINSDVGHFGNFDFQRQIHFLQPDNFDFILAYTDSANYAVGVYMNGAGYSLDETINVSGGFAKLFSSNSGDPQQLKMWKAGWNDAENGQLSEPLNYCPAF